MLGLNLFTVILPTGSFHLIILELGQPKIKYLLVISLLKRVVTRGVTVLFLGECVEVVPSQQDRDSAGVGQLAAYCARLPLVTIENAEVWSNSSSMA